MPATIAAHGGRYVASGGPTEVLEGSWTPKRCAVLEFPDMERFKTWWSSPEKRHCVLFVSGPATQAWWSRRVSRAGVRKEIADGVEPRGPAEHPSVRRLPVRFSAVRSTRRAASNDGLSLQDCTPLAPECHAVLVLARPEA